MILSDSLPNMTLHVRFFMKTSPNPLQRRGLKAAPDKGFKVQSKFYIDDNVYYEGILKDFHNDKFQKVNTMLKTQGIILN